MPQGGTGDSSVWRDFTKDNGTWHKSETEESLGHGYSFGAGTVYSGSAWLPACGYRTATEGHTRTVMHNGYLRTSTSVFRTPQQMSYAFGFYESKTELPGLHHRGHGFSVRCIRE